MAHSLHSLCAVFLFTHAWKCCRQAPIIVRLPLSLVLHVPDDILKNILCLWKSRMMCGCAAGVRRSQCWLIRRWGSCWCSSTTVTPGFRLLFPARHGKIGVSGASSAARQPLASSLVFKKTHHPCRTLIGAAAFISCIRGG